MSRDVVAFLNNEVVEPAGLYPGLTVVKHLVAKYGEKLSAKSTLGVGTEISFLMNFSTAESPAAATVSAEPHD
jgi:hypothetical protein